MGVIIGDGNRLELGIDTVTLLPTPLTPSP
jgi:hypothetical protein